MQKLYIIKIGGNVIDNDVNLSKFLQSFASIKENKILIHGGGKIATDIGQRLGIEAKMVEGRRITDSETLKVVTMVYGGLINKKIVTQLQSLGNDCIGLTGADGNIILSEKRPDKNSIDYGFVGDIKQVYTKPLLQFLSAGITPIIAPLTHDGEGNLLNTNADSVASAVAVALSGNFAVFLIYCFELKGVLYNFEDKESVIPEIDELYYSDLKNKGIISKGMIPKLDNSFEALNSGVSSVIIGNAEDLTAIVKGDEDMGTKLILRKKNEIGNLAL